MTSLFTLIQPSEEQSLSFECEKIQTQSKKAFG